MSTPRGLWYGRFLDKQSEVFECLRALNPVGREIAAKGHKSFDDSWNPDAHIELTLTVAECRRIQEVIEKYSIAAPASPSARDSGGAK